MFRYKLRTLLIVLALGPLLAIGWWGWREWRARPTASNEPEGKQRAGLPLALLVRRRNTTSRPP